MSSTANVPFSVAQQKSSISASLNSSLLLQFLFGIYTGLFPATLYIYLRKDSRTRSKDRIVIGSMTALYSGTAIFFFAYWVFFYYQFGTGNKTRVDLFLEEVQIPGEVAVIIIFDVIPFLLLLLADALLVWRCFHACKRSLRISLLPIALLIVEIGLAVASIVLRCLFDTNSAFGTLQFVRMSNHLDSATLVSTAATSVISTAAICFQIWRHTTPRSRAWMHYRTIIKALVESSGTYSVVVVLIAILDFANNGQLESSLGVANIQAYVSIVSLMVSGLAPTLMIARLSLSSGKELQVDTEGSSAHLPSDLIDPTLRSADGNLEGGRADFGVRQNEFTAGSRQPDGEEITAVSRAE
ncbi:hypothetical protein CPC08DRAFT_823572 [Agrocybe pediades]|nr:hypothetical protein CPC08DRAFT_823572 [Agrocybe pediades]